MEVRTAMSSSKDKKRKELKELFSDYVSKETIEGVIAGRDAEGELKKGNINYIIMQVRGDEIKSVPAFISRATDIIMSVNGIVSCIFSSLLVATLGFPFRRSQDVSGTCEQVVNYLKNDLRENIRAVYGSAEGLYGNLGSPRYMHFGPLLPAIEEKLGILFTLRFGESRQI